MRSSTNENVVSNGPITPFLKWAGGKRWLTKFLINEIGNIKGRYFEPFLGGAALFFALDPEKAFLADTNAELINTYCAVRDKPDEIKKLLQQYHKKHNKDYYYKVRNESFQCPIERAARFIYLNRTCWNGLYRVNLKGIFNVPIGTKEKVVLETDDWKEISSLLKRATLTCQDFEETINQAKKGDLVFADPPYTVRHNNNGFIKYNDFLFSWQDQIRLRDALLLAKKRGAKIIATNANHESIIEIYKPYFEIQPVVRASVIAGKTQYRGVYEEIVIR